MNEKNHSQHIYDLCKDHMHAYVLVETKDGAKFDGIITGLDEEHVYFAVPVGQDQLSQTQGQMRSDQRQPRPGFG